MRRSAIRNFRKAGLSESDGMKLSSSKARAVYDRYDIMDEEDSRQAMRRAQEYAKAEAARKSHTLEAEGLKTCTKPAQKGLFNG